MSDSPASKKQKVVPEESTPEPADLQDATPTGDDKTEYNQDSIPSNISYSKSRTPRKLLLGSADVSYTLSQPVHSNSNASLQVPSLQPPLSQDIRTGRRHKAYSQSPPRSPGRSQGRSPTRKLELIQLSPIKNSRVELQKLYNAHNSKQKKKERIYINKLVMNDFKSYAGRQVVGPFNTSFSAVVGPNGSGKSNVIDSMLFVFGFRANKMRQDKLADLIHKSEKYPDLPSCSIEVHFQYVIDLPDGTSKIDNEKEDLVIMRKAFRNNSSKYYINGKESNYKSVTELLKKEGIDLDHKRFLILQGEVENIAQMKPKAEKDNDDGLLEYLEDIIGTTNYKPLIEEKMLQVDTLNDICIEKENRFDIVDREKNSLEKDKDSALEFLEKEKQLTLLRSKKLQRKLYESNVKLKNSLQKVSDLNESLNKESQKFDSQQNEVKSLISLSSSKNDQLREFEKQEANLNKEKREIKTKEVSMEEMLKSLSQKKAKAGKSLKLTQGKIKENEGHLRNLEVAKTEYTTKIQDLNGELEKERLKLEELKFSLKDKTKGISGEILEYEKELEPWNIKIQDKKLEIQLVESEISVLNETQAKLKQEISNLRNGMIDATKEVTTKEGLIQDLKTEQKSLRDELLVGERECTNAKTKLKEMQEVLTIQRQRSTEARLALSNVENKNKVLTALSRLEKSGRIFGFHGRLGDLGTIPKKYDIAISTACPRLDDIVVETVECGQQCIEYLRKNKLGYARFILLDKLRQFNCNTIQTPEKVTRLFDLIKFNNKKFVPAFYSVLRDTLVANDLNQANRVAYGKRRYRVVTLDGKLIDISGTMSGGGNQVSRGLMKFGEANATEMTLYTPEDVMKIEKELEEREKNYRIASDTFHEMELELKRLRDREPEIELEISKLLMDVDSLKNELLLRNDTLKEKEGNYSDSIHEKEELDNAEKKMMSLKSECNEIEGQTKSKQDKIQNLKDEIMRIGGMDLQVQNAKVVSLSERIEITQSKLKKSKSDIKKGETELKKVQKTLKSAQKDVEICDTDLGKIEGDLSEARNMLSQLEESIEKILNSKNDVLDEVEELKEKISEYEADINEYKSFKLEIDNKIGKLNSLVNYIKKEIKEVDTEMATLKIRDVTRTLELLDEGKLNDVSFENLGISTKSVEEESNIAIIESEQNNATHSSGSGDIPKNATNPDTDESTDEMNIDESIGEISKGIPRLNDSELQNIDTDMLDNEILALEDYINTTDANIDILEEYTRRLIEYKKRKQDLNNAVDKRDNIRQILEELKKNRYDEFMEGFSIISMTLKEMYQMITMGGNAELELVDSLDPFSEGVTFSVMPPKKSWRNITNLSGGEKTLSSLALVFALHKYKPTPLYVMDEIDAALDFRNVSIVANYIKERTKNAQFIVISLRNNMFELAQQLIGIYKRDNMTKSVTIQNKDIIT